MSVEVVIARIAEINGMLAPPRAPAEAPPVTTTFGTALDQATGAKGAAALGWAPAAGAGTAGQRMLAAAQAEVGQAEQPPGSNDSPRIAEYRTATAGSGIGPWCAYFVSWAARQAGAPVGEQGQGFGSVAALAAWGERTGRSLPAGSTPQPGDVIVWGGRHVGIVENVLPDGRIQTIEGNSSDRVARRTYGPDGGGATSYVRLG
ncbi:MAG TPA: CHAP domain-containing protein [Solirubrobacteraceae bacterium]|jgi:hypothetical protein|nr:CHAP domain-containing protein [Solirubrobacteraceae bacterium]